MLSGMFFVKFIANNNAFGEGLIVIRNGCVNGGDASYLYQGRFEYYGDDVKATVEVKHYKGPLNSVMGPLKEFSLILTGKKSGNNFELIGGMPNVPNLNIKIVGTKVAELFD